MMDIAKGLKPCGAVRRVIAFAIDVFILMMIARMVGMLLFDVLSKLDIFTSHVVSLLLVLVYFGLSESVIFRGRTLGKWMLRIKVVDKNGRSLSFFRSCVRTIIFWLPFLFVGLFLPPNASTVTAYAFVIVSIVIVFGLGFALLYFFLFNERSSQSVHDLVVRSYVVVHTAKERGVLLSVWKWHYLIASIASLCVCAMAFMLFMVVYKASMQVNSNLIHMVQSDKALEAVNLKIREVEGVQYAYTFIRNIGAKEDVPKSFFVFAKVNQRPITPMLKKIAHVVLTYYPKSKQFERIIVTGNYGYDIGFSKVLKAEVAGHTPSEWQTK
jgi:uncharacterized RDD family membrane protein YckC